jgi:PAS domain S-box-containing protein
MATVLVVDDRAASREVARAALDHGGHDVVEAVDGQEALTVTRTVQPDVIVTDMVMPGMDGYEFVHRLRADASTADIPVLFYTAHYSAEEAEALATAYGVTQVLAKSADPLDLLAAVDKALRGRLGPRPPAAASTGLTTEHSRAVNAKLLEKVLALDESEARFEAFADLSPVGIAFGGPDMSAIYVNSRLSEITAIPAGDLLGTGWLRCLAPERQDQLRDGDALGAGTATFDGPVTLAGGLRRHLQVIVRPLEDSNNDRSGFVAVVNDVTPLVEAEQRRHAEERKREVEERERIAERFASLARLCGAVAHDFNNMLSVMLNFGNLVEEAVDEAVNQQLTSAKAESILQDLDQIARAGKRAAHLTHQLLTFGGREIVQPTVVSVNAIVEEVCDMADTAVGEQIIVTAELDPHLRNTRVDGSQLCQVLFNLAINARDAMPRGGHLAFRSSNETNLDSNARIPGLAAANYVHIAVIDDGEGMTPEVLDRAIEPFFTTKSKGHGTGLGLATAYGSIKQAGGDIAIDSSVGNGTAIHIYLPATEDPLQTSQAAVATHVTADQTVLLVEDEDALRHAAHRILTGAGYRVISAANGEEALEVARQYDGTIHGVLTDVVMPRMNGPELAVALRSERPDIPVLYMSGYAAALMSEQGLLEPRVTVVGKPFSKDELLVSLGTVLMSTAGAAG